jgi:predicted nucleotidyltransferase
MYTEKDIETIKNTIIQTIPGAVGIILFGSYAQGTAREDSDMDFLVLTDRDYERQKKLQMLASLRWNIAIMGYNADVLLKKEDKYVSDKEYPTLSRVIGRTGKALWRKN